MMTVAEQQAQLGVSAEESKVQRLKRQQSRFRDRGGAFVPSNSNPLVDLLLARTVSGESPSKARQKGVASKHPSPRKSHPTSPTRKATLSTVPEEDQVVAGSSKPKARKRKAKVVEPKVDPAAKSAPRRRGRPPKVQKNVPDPNIDTEQPLPNTKTKARSKGKAEQCNVAPLTSDRKSKPKPRAKPNSAKPVVEVLASDDDQTLVEVLRKTKSNPKGRPPYENNGETDEDDDLPLVRNRVLSPAGEARPSGTRTATHVKTIGVGSSGKNAGNGPALLQIEKVPETNAKKRLVPRNEDEGVAAPPAKKGKATKSTNTKSKNTIESEPAPHAIKEAENSGSSKGKGKTRVKSNSDAVKPVVVDDERPPVPKPQKRKKDDNYDDRPRKAIKFSDTVPPHSSSQRLKENQSDIKHKSAIEPSSVKDEPDASHPKLTTKPPSRSMTSKGPPLEVLERIKASAAQHLNRADSEPDELDCLSHPKGSRVSMR